MIRRNMHKNSIKKDQIDANIGEADRLDPGRRDDSELVPQHSSLAQEDNIIHNALNESFTSKDLNFL